MLCKTGIGHRRYDGHVSVFTLCDLGNLQGTAASENDDENFSYDNQVCQGIPKFWLPLKN